MSELELKFHVPAPALEAIRDDLRSGEGGAPERIRLQARYFDTPDGRLARARIALRVRIEGDRRVLTFKAARPHSVDRIEENVDLGAAGPADAEDRGPPPSLDRLGREATHLLAHALGGDVDPARLVERFATDVQRTRRQVEVGQAVVEIALDEGELRAGDARAPIRELELERISGDAAALFHLAEAWSARHFLWLDVISKAERGMRLARGDIAGPPVMASPPRVDRSLPPDDVLRRVLAACLAQVLPNLSALGHGAHDADHVHQARVGLRRLRTALRDLRRLSDAVDPAWEEPLAQAFRKLGEHRDAHVLPDVVRPELERAGAPLTAWRGGGGADVPRPGDVVVDPALQRTLLRILAFAEAGDAAAKAFPSHDSHAGGKTSRRRLARRLDTLHRRVARDADHFDELPADEQHHVRKQLKRLRYLAEFAAPLWPARRVSRYIDRLKPAQDALGRQNDEAVALERFRETARTDPQAWFAVGFLEARREDAGREGRRALRRISRADRFWR